MSVAQELLSIKPEVSFVQGDAPDVLTQIYEQDINLSCYQRSLSPLVIEYSQILKESSHLNIRSVVTMKALEDQLFSLLPDHSAKAAFVADLMFIIEMYACLFELDEVGLRLQVLDRAMCPRFHTDKLGCRLVTAYQGAGTEWLDEHYLDRSKLGAGNGGLPDEKSGLYADQEQINQATVGDVLLLKGDGWFGMEGKGVVHRSPAVPSGQKRLVATLDFA